MRTKLNLCKRNLLLCAFAFLLGSFPGFAKSRQGPSSSLPDRPAAVTPQRSVGPAAAGSAATFIAHVKIDRSGQETIVRVEGNGRLNCQTERLNNPERLVLDCFGARLALAQRLIPGGLKPILRVRLGQFNLNPA